MGDVRGRGFCLQEDYCDCLVIRCYFEKGCTTESGEGYDYISRLRIAVSVRFQPYSTYSKVHINVVYVPYLSMLMSVRVQVRVRIYRIQCRRFQSLQYRFTANLRSDSFRCLRGSKTRSNHVSRARPCLFRETPTTCWYSRGARNRQNLITFA